MPLNEGQKFSLQAKDSPHSAFIPSETAFEMN